MCVHVYNAAGMTYELLEFFQLAHPQLWYSYSRLNINAFSVAIEAASYSIKHFSSQRFHGKIMCCIQSVAVD